MFDLIFRFKYPKIFLLIILIILAYFTFDNSFTIGFIGGTGALIADLLIFRFVKVSFQDEFNKLKRTKALSKANKLIEKTLGRKLMVYVMYAFSGLLIA